MNDEGRRGNSAVAFSLLEGSRDDLFVFMDQLVQTESRGLGHRVWHHEVFTTNIRIDKQQLDRLEVPEQQLRGIGLMVVSALRAYYAEQLGFEAPWRRA